MSSGTSVLVSIAQVAAGGTIVQGLLALARRRSELKNLDKQTDSVAVATANSMIITLREELTRREQAADAAEKRRDTEREETRRQIAALRDEVETLRGQLVAAQAELYRLQHGRGGPGRDRNGRERE